MKLLGYELPMREAALIEECILPEIRAYLDRYNIKINDDVLACSYLRLLINYPIPKRISTEKYIIAMSLCGHRLARQIVINNLPYQQPVGIY